MSCDQNVLFTSTPVSSLVPISINASEDINDGSKVNMIPSGKKIKLTSPALKDFDRHELPNGSIKAVCKHCNRRFEGSSNKETSHLLNHLKSCTHKFFMSKESGQ